MAIPKTNTRLLGGLQRSSAPLTEPRAHLELFRIACDRDRLTAEMLALQTRINALQNKMDLIAKREAQLYGYLDTKKSKLAATAVDDGAFVMEY